MTDVTTRSVAKAINPATGQPDLMGALRHVTQKLSEGKDIQPGVLYHVLKGPMRPRLDGLGIPAMYVADFTLLMQEVGLARHYGAGRNTVWEIVDIRFFDEIMTENWLLTGLSNLCERHELTTSRRKLREMDTPGKKSPEKSDTSSDYLEPMAEMVAEVERLRETVVVRDGRIRELESKLAQAPENNPAAVAAALVERFRKPPAS